jgi:uncharacterized low-complexity protein
MATDLNKGVTAQLVVHTLLAGSLALVSGAVQAAGNPFALKDLPGGYKQAAADSTNEVDSNKEMKAEGKCGGKTASEAVCGIYQIGSSHKDPSKVKEGKCGGHKVVESLCGGAR